MNQAFKIREQALKYLKNSESEKELISNDSEIKGIRYSVLKKILLDSPDNFTEGAVTSSLNTLKDKIDNVYKRKTPKGVYFYYLNDTQKDYQIKKDEKLSLITHSNDFLNLKNHTDQLADNITKILLNTSKDNYIKTSKLDISYLRKILTISNQLKSTLQEYTDEKSFELISKNLSAKDDDDLPF